MTCAGAPSADAEGGSDLIQGVRNHALDERNRGLDLSE